MGRPKGHWRYNALSRPVGPPIWPSPALDDRRPFPFAPVSLPHRSKRSAAGTTGVPRGTARRASLAQSPCQRTPARPIEHSGIPVIKKFALIIAAALALTTAGLTAAAEAGGCGGRGISHGPSFSRHYQSSSENYRAHQKAIAAKRRKLALKLAEKRRRIAAVKAAAAKRATIAEVRRERAAKQRLAARLEKRAEDDKIDDVAKVTPPAPEQKPAEIAGTEAGAGNIQVAEVRPLTCKRYIPSEGLTVTVPCQ